MSLNPRSRSDEVAEIGMWDGLMSGACAALPSSMAVWYGMKYSPTFVKYTNWQSRTAMVIMPPLFMFGLASEQKVQHKMRQMAEEKAYSNNVSEWAETQKQEEREKIIQQIDKNNLRKKQKSSLSQAGRDNQLSELYLKTVEHSGVRVVSGSTLGIHHRIANFWQENPFKILTAMSVPAVAYIFKGRSDQAHLQLQSKIMHTRVFGQFSVIIILLSLMGFKTYMDTNGRFITELDAQLQVEDMKAARQDLIDRLVQDKENAEHIQKLKLRAKKEIQEERNMRALKKVKRGDVADV